MLAYPIIQGAKGGEEKAHTPVETPNNLLSVAYAKVLLAVAEGELAGTPTGQDIFLDGTPLLNPDGSSNFGGVTWEWRSGRSDQEYIKGLPEVSNEYSIGLELRDNAPWVRQITKTEIDAVRITFQWPALLSQQTNGDTLGISMQYAVDVSTDGGAFTQYQLYTIDGKTNTAYERTHRIDLPPAENNWVIRARRVTPDSEAGTVQDTINIKSYAEVVDVKQRYPNTALLYVTFDSRLFGSNIPRISVKTKGRLVRVPNTYDPVTRVYTGIWSGEFKWAYTDNPAWVFYDIMTQDRFGLGNKVTPEMVDKWAMYEVAQYCDVMVDNGEGNGTKEPRHTCNIFIQERRDAWTVLRDMASIFNGMTYWNGNTFVAIADKEEDISNAPIFSRSNTINGSFDYQASDDKSIYTSALVSYDDPESHYGTQVEATYETEQILRWGGDRQVEISAIGCTSRGEAQRKGKYTLVTNMFNRQISFQTGLQGMSPDVLPGKVIQVADPLLGGRAYTGRIKIATGNVITLDREASGKPGDLLFLTKPDGKTEARTIQSVTKNIFTVTLPYSVQMEPNAVFYVEAADLKSQLYRVTKITNPQEGIFEIEGVEYNESKYGNVDNGARLETRPISVVPAGLQAAPANVVVSGRNYVEQTMSINVMTINWDQTPNASLYEVQWRVNEGDWVNAGITGAPMIEVKGIYTGRYVARVRAINAGGIKSVWSVSASTDLVGKVGLPPVLASLTTTPMLFGIRLDWEFPEGAEDTLRTEIMYSETTLFAGAIKLGDFSYPTDSHEMHGLLAGKNFWFWGRLVDRSGNVGEWKPLSTEVGVIGQSMINDNGAYNDYFAGLISDSALDKDLYDRIELIDGPATLPNSVNERIKTVNDRVDQTNEDLDNAIADLEEQISKAVDALVYDPTKTYKKGDIVRSGQNLYQALVSVPVNTTPPNSIYWKDIGDILEDANGLAAQVNLNTTNITILDGKVTASASTLESIQSAWRDDDGDGSLIDALNSYDNRAQISEERQTRASENEAFAQRLVVISAQVDENKGQISTLETTVATNDTAQSQRVDIVSARVVTEAARLDASISSEQTARTTADSALGTRVDQVAATITSEGKRLDAAVQSEQTARVNADGAIGTRIDTVLATQDTENKRLDAAVKTEQTARTNGDTALGTRIDTVGASVVTQGNRLDAAVLSEQTARANADSAIGTRIDQVQATMTTADSQLASDIKTEQTARVGADGALSSRIDLVAASVTTETTNRTAAIASEATARANADSAQATRIDQVSAAITNEETARKAAVTSEQTARINADAALASRIDTVEAGGVDLTQIKALIQDEATARTTADTALGTRITTVQTTAGNNTAAIQTVSTAQATTAGKVNTSWTVRMEANTQGQYVAAGIALGIGNEGGLLQSQFLVRADRFAIVNGSTTTTTAPFVVQNGQVFMNEALISKAMITNGIIGSTLSSSAYTNWGPPIMVQDFANGQLVAYSADRVNTYVVFNRYGVQVVVDGVLRVRMGTW
jgi:predicted phage tail protein